MSDLYDYLDKLMCEFRAEFRVDPANTWSAQKYLWRNAVAVFEFTRTLGERGTAAANTAINELRVVALCAGFSVREIENTINSARRRVNG
jgi:hypothetical protein